MIINLTQHPATAEQIAAGVMDMQGDALLGLKEALTFEAAPDATGIGERAEYIAELAASVDSEYPPYAMIGGALWLMAPLARELRARGITPLFAFTRREAVETVAADGSIKKTSVFRHAGFVESVE